MSPRDPKRSSRALWDFRRKGWTFRSGGDGPTAPSGSAFFKSADGGSNVDRPERNVSRKGFLPKPWGRVAVAIAPSNPDVVYALIESTRSALYRSADGGKTWEERDRSQMMVWRPFYFANLIVDPKDENKVFKPGRRPDRQQRRRQELQRHLRRRRSRRLARCLDRPAQPQAHHRRRRRRPLVLPRRRQQLVEGQQPADLAVLPRERRYRTIRTRSTAACRTTASGSATRLTRAASPTAAGRTSTAAMASGRSPIRPTPTPSTPKPRAATSRASTAAPCNRRDIKPQPEYGRRSCASTGTRPSH